MPSGKITTQFWLALRVLASCKAAHIADPLEPPHKIPSFSITSSAVLKRVLIGGFNPFGD